MEQFICRHESGEEAGWKWWVCPLGASPETATVSRCQIMPCDVMCCSESMGDLAGACSGSPASRRHGEVVNNSARPVRPPTSASSAASRIGADQPEVVFVSAPDAAIMCPVCDRAMRYPVKLGDCGHRCCSGCLVELVRCAPSVLHTVCLMYMHTTMSISVSK